MPAYELHPAPSDSPACDPITGLPSRARLLDALQRMLEDARRTGCPVAVLNIRLVGRDPRSAVDGAAPLLRDSADLVRMIIRDCGLAARVSGDDFAVALAEVRHPSVALGTARRLHRALRGLHGSAGHIGVALYPDDALDAEALIRAAERATPTMDAVGYARAPIQTG
ncbi:MAG TPA: GGDEF domain-containing protein [Longimicrobiales bacterium]|nr:GGDEF domain-containing protein [Longimicrobiales bacterium]